MKIVEHPKSLVIQTTDLHLPRRIDDQLHQAYKVHYDEEGCFVRVAWNREA